MKAKVARPARSATRKARADDNALKRKLIQESWRKSPVRRAFAALTMLGVIILAIPSAFGQQQPLSLQSIDGAADDVQAAADEAVQSEQIITDAFGQEGLSSTLQIMLLLTVISLAPALLMMTTSFIRVLVVLGLLRQALGTQQLPPSQVITSLALFITLAIMTPVWTQVYDNAVAPYSEGTLGPDQAWAAGQIPVRRFMATQIERTGNADDVLLFLDYIQETQAVSEADPPNYVYFGANKEAGETDVPLSALLPAFMLSELKTAFLIGFQIYLPFLILDMVVASVMISMGMLMLPPVLISLPFKLLLFVLVDGWRLVVEMLLLSFEPFG